MYPRVLLTLMCIQRFCDIHCKHNVLIYRSDNECFILLVLKVPFMVIHSLTYELHFYEIDGQLPI